jgi:hypothetical protein
MQPPLDRPHPALVHREARPFRLRPLALGGVLAAGAAPLFLGVTGIAALSDEGPHEALEVVLLLLLLRFSAASERTLQRRVARFEAQRGWRAFSAPSTPGARGGCRIP